MSEQMGTHSVPLGGGDERPPELEAPRTAAAPFEPVGVAQSEEKRGRGWRPWAIIGVAIAVPAVVAAVLVTTLGGGSDSPAAVEPTVSSATTTTAVVEPATARPAPPAAAATPTTTERPSATTSGTATAAPDRAAASGAGASESTASGASETVTSVVTAELATPEERLGAWGEMVDVTLVEGDSLWALALEYETTVEAIAMLNAITDPSELSVGQMLTIPVGFAESLTPVEEAAAATTVEAGSGTEQAATTSFTTTPPADTALADWPNVVQWTIEPGDSLSGLATTFDTTPEAIMALNGIADANVVYAGTTISIPVGYGGSVEGSDLMTEPEATTTAAVTTSAADELQESAAPAAPTTTSEESAAGGDYLEDAAPPASEDSAAGGDFLEEEAPGSQDGGDFLEQ